ncbi:MAG: PIG-L family deacetylase [Ginsengibacter sp.]
MFTNKKASDIIFNIVAHADDWQLFMNPDTYNDLVNPDKKVVFIVTTAGDAGKGEAFWRAREAGMKSSIVYCLASIQQLQYDEGFRIIDNQSIFYWSLNNTTSYFLRLPDGSITGEGFRENNYQSLQKLENRAIPFVISQDEKIKLSSWSDFTELLNKIISVESESSIGDIFIKFLDPDIENNPLDHADHQSTGRAILSLKNLPSCIKVLFKGYSNSCINRLTCEEVFWKASIFAAYEKTVFENTGYSTLREDMKLYQKWILSCPELYVAK